MASFCHDIGQMTRETSKTYADNLSKWATENAVLFASLGIETNFSKINEEFEEVQKTIEKTDIDVVFIGKTSSGKSLVINRLLGIDVMRSGIGHTTSGAVRIKPTSSPSSYYQFYNDEDRHYIDFSDEDQLDDFHDKVDLNADSNAFQCVKLFLSKNILKQESIISEKVAILDTPGMDQKLFKDEEVKRSVLEADALIIVVDIVTWANISAIQELLDDKMFFVRPSVIVAINKCDTLLEEKRPKRRDNAKKNIKKEMSELAVFKDRTTEEMDNLIFFVSAKLVSTLNATESRSQMREEEREMVDEFHRLEQTILSTARWNCETRKMERMLEAFKKCIDKLNIEAERIASDISIVIRYIRQLKDHIRESTLNVNETVNRDFVRTAYIEDLHELRSGREKVLAFLNHCAEQGYEDMKSTIIRQPVEERIAKFVDIIFREEFIRVTCDDPEKYLRQFFDLLDPVDLGSWSFEDEQVKIENKIKNVNETFRKELKKKEEAFNRECKEFVAEKKRAMEQNLEEMRREVAKREERVGVGPTIKKAGEKLSKNPFHGFSASPWKSALKTIGAPGTMSAGAILFGIGRVVEIAEGLSEEAKKTPDKVQFLSKFKKVKPLEEKVRQYGREQEKIHEHLIQCEREQETHKIAKLEKFKRENEKKKFKTLEECNKEVTESIKRNLEREKQIEEHIRFQRDTMLKLYICVISIVSESAEMRLNATENVLDKLNSSTNHDSVNITVL